MTPTPTVAAPTRVRAEGALDAVRHSDRTFTLVLSDGRPLAGRLTHGKVVGLARLLGRKLVVFGEGRFDAAGGLVGVEADGYIPSDGQLWTVTPDDLPLSRDVIEEQARRVREVIGQWPFDEEVAESVAATGAD